MGDDTSSNGFEAILAEVLDPLAEAMVAQGVSLGTATEALKQSLLRAAISQAGEHVSDSRASVMTGLHRKDVRRLRQATAAHLPRRKSNAAAAALQHWATQPEFQDEAGVPRDLTRVGQGAEPGFDDLIRATRVDMAPGTVLRALRDAGAVVDGPDGTLRLSATSFVPAPGSPEQLAAYRATIATHLRAATANLLASEGAPRNFDRILRYSHLSADAVALLTAKASDEAQAMLLDLSKEAETLRAAGGEVSPAGRFSIGIYVLPERGDAE